VKVLVAGAGAVGSWIGGELAAGGADVILVARGAQGVALAKSGLHIQRTGQPAFEVRPGVVGSVAEGLRSAPFDLILVAVKSFATESLAEELAALDTPSCVLSLQNGVGNEDALARTLPQHQVCAASITSACTLVAPGQVQVGSKGGIGLAGTSTQARWIGTLLSDLAARLQARDIPTTQYRDARALKWSKLLLNMLGAATCAVLAWPPARVFENPELFAVELDAWREALVVMNRLEIKVVNLPGYPVAWYARMVRWLPQAGLFRLMAPRLARGRGDRLPGSAADLVAGRPETEIAWLNGAVARAGETAGLTCPINAKLDQLVANLAAGRVDRASYVGRPDAVLAWLDRS